MSSNRYADALRMRDTAVTAEQWRERARECAHATADSFARSDTDGFLSQWASGLHARLYLAWAELAENGYEAEFPALFTADGDLITDARSVHTRYGWSWVYGPQDAPTWVRLSQHSNPVKRLEADRRKGHTCGRVRRPAFVVLEGDTATSVCPVTVAVRDSATTVITAVSATWYDLSAEVSHAAL